MKIGFVHLGCSKNLIDTEMVIGLFKNYNYEIVSNPKEAEIILINTCGFIESAKIEGINTILEMSEYKKTGKCKLLIVIGCLVQRYKKELKKALPEVDLFISIDEYDNMWKKISNIIKNEQEKENMQLDYMNRMITTGNITAYLKIAEGCSNRCIYCTIPYIRGPYISRRMEDIIKEAKSLAKKGYKEIIVIAQDTTKYGIDLYGEPKLTELLDKLSEIKEFKWIRFLYAYPETITDDLINLVKNNNKICKYFDIPIQHISNTVLKRMNRKSDENSIKKLIQHIRKEIPNVVLRTSLIVGFPGETNEDFGKLYDFVKDTKFEKLGTFIYSKEDGTPAAKIKAQIHHNTKKSRYNKIMKLQQEISNESLQKYVGKKLEILIEDITFDRKYYIGRSQFDIPDMDGVVYVKNDRKIDIGAFVKCKVTSAKQYDLIANIDTK